MAAWSAAVDACRTMNESHPLAYSLLRHAEALAAEGERDRASRSAREALQLADAMGARPLGDEIEALVRRARLSVAEDSAPDELTRLGLTAREREVLELVVEGHSNGQIAERLFISRKTASVHVSNILAKLGATTRVEAAAIAHRRGLVAIATVPEVGEHEDLR